MRKKMTLAKWVSLGAVIFFVFVWFMGHAETLPQKKQGNNQAQGASAVVHASNNEELRYLTAKMTQLTEQNKKVIQENSFLKNRMDQTGNSKLYAAQQKMQLLIKSQQSRLHDLSRRIGTLKNQGLTPNPGKGDYPLNRQHGVHRLSNQMITIVSDMSLPVSAKGRKNDMGYRPILKTARAHQISNDRSGATAVASHKNDTPYFTIPANATLADVVLQSDILGEVPVNNTLLQPAFKFKAIVGRKALLASNGIRLPSDLSGIVFEGYSVGNMAMSCARGYITKLLFTWHDGSFTVVGGNQKGSGLNPQDALGYISTPFGNPCLPGKYITDAPRVLSSIAVMAGLTGGSNAFAKTQTTTASSPYQSISQVTGNAFKYMGGKVVGTGADKALAWYTSRINGVFDVVYIPSSVKQKMTQVVVNITQTIPIDKKRQGRKIDYAHNHQNQFATHQLD
jgi:integrating conjugative element protein (TIGR03752 family)